MNRFVTLFFGIALTCQTWSRPGCLNSIRSITHGVARDTQGHVLRYVPFNGHGVILDSQLTIALTDGRSVIDKKWQGTLHHIERTAAKKNEDFHYWVTDKTVDEVASGWNSNKGVSQASNFGFPEGTRRIKPSVSRESDEYKSMLEKLRELKVGIRKGHDGVADQNIVADVLFSESRPNTVPTFATADKGIIFPLCRLDPLCEKSLGRGTLFKDLSSGFTTTITDGKGNSRKIRIIPFDS